MINKEIDEFRNKYKKEFNNIYKEKCSKYTYTPSILPSVERIIVIGDIHGDMKMLIKCLKLAKLIDNNMNWTGGNTVVVQVGDQIDSCRYNKIDECNNINNYTPSNDIPDDINILYFMTELHDKAIKDGGAVYSIMGNHELMNVTGDMTYVSYKNIDMFKNYKTNTGNIIADGMNGRIHAFKPGNTIANFLACTRKVALIIGSNLFVHAGIVPKLINKYNLDDMNMILTLFLLDEYNQPTLFNDLFRDPNISPLWTRMFGMKVNNCNELMQPLKTIYKVDRIYVGHTPQLDTGISSQCKNKIWMTDVGMSHSFDKITTNNAHRHAQVLEILNDGKTFNILK